jgi:hypothetical protein
MSIAIGKEIILGKHTVAMGSHGRQIEEWNVEAECCTILNTNACYRKSAST